MTGRWSDESLRKCQRLVQCSARRFPFDRSGARQTREGGQDLDRLMRGGADLIIVDLVEHLRRSRLVEHCVNERGGVEHYHWPNSSRTSASTRAVSITV